MGLFNIWVLSLIALSSFCVVSSVNVICYYGPWAVYRTGNGHFTADNINSKLCTHLIYTFVGIDGQGNISSTDSYLDFDLGMINKTNSLKENNTDLITLLAVGGWNQGSKNYSLMAGDAGLRANFISQALNWTRTYGFDGFDVDWEYPARRDSVYGTADIDNFSTLIKELKAEFSKYGLLVTAAVSAAPEAVKLSYNVSAICEYLDMVHVMTYDMYGTYNYTGYNAALHMEEGNENVATADIYAVDVSIQYWLDEGCPVEKIAMGVPMYARTFTLTNATDNGVRAPSTTGMAGPYTQEAGFVGYNEFCEMRLNETDWVIHWDSTAKVPYGVLDTDWVSFDDPNSLTLKIHWALNYNITNIMLWSIETDDFRGICGDAWPLLRSINVALGRSVN